MRQYLEAAQSGDRPVVEDYIDGFALRLLDRDSGALLSRLRKLQPRIGKHALD